MTNQELKEIDDNAQIILQEIRKKHFAVGGKLVYTNDNGDMVYEYEKKIEIRDVNTRKLKKITFI